MSFGERLKQLRQKRGMSQGKLADIVDVHLNSIFSWEKGARTPDIEKLTALAEALDTTVAYLTGETDSPGRVSSSGDCTSAIATKEPSRCAEDSNYVPGLEFWGSVVDAARKSAMRRDPQELEDVYMMLSRALAAVEDARNAISLEQESALPVAASA